MKLSHKINEADYATVTIPNVCGWFIEPLASGSHVSFNHTTFFNAVGVKQTVFHVKPVYYETVDGTYRPLEEVCSYHGNRKIILNEKWTQISPRYLSWLQKRQRLLGKELLIDYGFNAFGLQPRHMQFATVTDFYPNPNPETTSVDGYVLDFGTTGTWSTSHDYATGSHVSDSATVIYARADKSNSGGTLFLLYRSHILFDTASIPDTDSISAADFNIYKVDNQDNQNDTFHICESTLSTNTSVATTDFDSYTAVDAQTSLGSIDMTSINTGSYTAVSLNATGWGIISKTGVTKFGSRLGLDINETASHASAPTTSTNMVEYSSADETGTTQDPKLTVTHAAAGGSVTHRLLTLGVG